MAAFGRAGERAERLIIGRLVAVANVAQGPIARNDALFWRECITAMEADVLRAHELHR